MSEQFQPLAARASVAAPADTTGRFMYMPAGRNVIAPSCKGKSVVVVVDVKPEAAAAALNAQLAAVSAKLAPHKPYFDFNHDDERASFWPAKFEAAPDGVYVTGEFSASGKAAIEGKDFRGFSPLFYTDAEIDPKALLAAKGSYAIPAGKIGSEKAPAQIVCNPDAKLNFGGLVNDPAFKQISPLWAKDAGEPGDAVNQNNEENEQMKKTIADLQAANKSLESQITALQAKADRSEIENAQLAAKQADVRANEAEIATQSALAQVEAQNKKSATAAVKDAVARGAILAKDTKTQDALVAKATEDPAFLDVIGAMTGGSKATLVAKATPSGIEVTGTGISDLCKTLIELQAKNAQIQSAAEKIRHAKEVHAFYAKELKDNKDLMLMPLEAATSADNIGTLAGTLVAQRTLELLKLEFPALGTITTDYSDQPAQFNQTTTSRIITVPAVMTYDATIDTNTGRAKGWVIGTQAVTTDASVTIDNHKAVEVSFDSNTLASTARRLFDEQAEAAHYALGKAMVDSLYAKIIKTTGGFTTNAAFAEASVDFGRRTFATAARILNKQGVPQTNRFALVNSDYMEKLLQDPTLVSLAVYQKAEIITDSQLPPISRFQVIEAPNLPTTGNMAAFFGHRCSLVVQSRVPNDYTTILGPSSSYGQVMVVTNPDTGISVLLVQYVAHQGGYAAWRIAGMWGTAVGNEKGGQIVTSA